MTLSHLTPAEIMPWPKRHPFEVKPALERMCQSGQMKDSHFAVDERLPAYQKMKQSRLLQADDRTGQAGAPDQEVLEAIANEYERQTGLRVNACAAPFSETLSQRLSQTLSQTLAEDFVILHDEPGRGFVVRYLSVCFASNWRPAQKLNLGFTQIHAPIPHNDRLLAARPGIEEIAFRQSPMVRYVWLLSPTTDLWQNPDDRGLNWTQVLKRAQENSKDDDPKDDDPKDDDPKDDDPKGDDPKGDDYIRLLSSVCLRVERQTTMPLPAIGRAVFFVRVLVCPLLDVLQMDETRAKVLSDALATMSPEFAKYRGMEAVRWPIVAALRGLCKF